MSYILVVERSQALRAACARAAEALGAEVRTAGGVVEALDQVAEARPQLLLTALELDDLPVTSLVAALRASPQHRATPIFGVTSREAESAHVTQLKLDGVLLKQRNLLRQLERLLGELGLRERRLGARVLVVDDAAVSRMLHAKLLHAAGAEVTVASDGLEALELCAQHTFDLALLDVEMPRLDGPQTLAALRANGLKLAILALTGHQDPARHTALRACGFDDVLTKQGSRAELLARCEAALAPQRRAG